MTQAVTIIGVGRMGSRHLAACADLDVPVAGVVDIDDNALTVARQRNLPCAASVDDAPDDWFDDTNVIVAVPYTAPPRHAARLGRAHRVLIEKPSQRWAAALTQTRGHTHRTAAHVGLQERYNSAFRGALEAMPGDPGDMVVSTVREAVPQSWAERSPSGLARDLLVHDTDLVRRIAGAADGHDSRWTVETAAWNESPHRWDLSCVVRLDLPDTVLRWEGNASWLRTAGTLQRRLTIEGSGWAVAADMMSGTVTTTPATTAAACRDNRGEPALRSQIRDWLGSCTFTATLRDWQQAAHLAAAAATRCDGHDTQR